MKPLVSICMITYNHANFIRAAIESVTAQKTDFDFELVIGEDCSTDQTRAIIEEYVQQYPHLIRLLPADKNYGAMGNLIRTYNACTGKYVAMLEGDDHWTADDKLQQQANFMEAHPEYSMVCHNATIVNHITGKTYDFQQLSERDFLFKDTLNKHLCPTASIFLRREWFTPPDFMIGALAADQVMCQLLAIKGKIKYWPTIMSVYNIHEQGASIIDGKKMERTLNNRIEKLEQLNHFSNKKYNKEINQAIQKVKLRIWYIKNQDRYSYGWYKSALLRLYGLRKKLV